jgi:predicted amidohydrolase
MIGDRIGVKMEKRIIISGIQLVCDRSKKQMLLKAEQFMNQAVKSNPYIDLFVLPEQFYQLDCYDFEEEYGEEAHGIFEDWLANCAIKYNANIIGGSYAVKINEINQNTSKIRNRCIVVDREGNVVGHYDKIHLFDAFGVKESDVFEAGNELGLFDLDIGKVGVWICYDTRFPEISRALAENGADILCVPAAFYKPNSDQWEILIKAAATYNVLPVVAVNQYGNLPNGRGFFGRSMMVDPKGLIVAGISDKEGYFTGEIDLSYTKLCRDANPEMKNRRVDLYREWI